MGRIEKDISAGAVAARHAVEEENPLLEISDLLLPMPNNYRSGLRLEKLHVIHLNFSDPWPKKGNHKRRLSSAKVF